MGKLRVMASTGDKTVTWDRDRVEVGDREALEAVREAERIFEEERARGATGFKVDSNRVAERIDCFDPEADEIVMVPRIVGG